MHPFTLRSNARNISRMLTTRHRIRGISTLNESLKLCKSLKNNKISSLISSNRLFCAQTSTSQNAGTIEKETVQKRFIFEFFFFFSSFLLLLYKQLSTSDSTELTNERSKYKKISLKDYKAPYFVNCINLEFDIYNGYRNVKNSMILRNNNKYSNNIQNTIELNGDLSIKLKNITIDRYNTNRCDWHCNH